LKIRKLAIVSSGTDSYGTKRSIETLIGAFKGLGVDTVVVCLRPGEMTEVAERAGAQAIVADVAVPDDFSTVAGSLCNLYSSAARASRLAIALRDSGAEGIIIRQPRLMPLVAKASRIAGIPGFWVMPNLVSNRYPLRLNALVYDLLLARHGMTAIANSYFTQTSLLNLFSKSAVAHLGISPDQFDPDDVAPVSREQFGFTHQDDVFGIFGRILPFKGQLIFIRAMARVLKRYPSIRLLICGGPVEGAYGAELRREISAHSLEGKVVLSGTDAELGIAIPRLYAMCDVIVNSRLDPEPFGLSIIEGMLMRKPLLVHASGGPAETVDDGIDGWHIEAPTVASFECGLLRAMSERESWCQKGENARAHALREFTNIHAAERILSIMQSRVT